MIFFSGAAAFHTIRTATQVALDVARRTAEQSREEDAKRERERRLADAAEPLTEQKEQP